MINGKPNVKKPPNVHKMCVKDTRSYRKKTQTNSFTLSGRNAFWYRNQAYSLMTIIPRQNLPLPSLLPSQTHFPSSHLALRWQCLSVLHGCGVPEMWNWYNLLLNRRPGGFRPKKCQNHTTMNDEGIQPEHSIKWLRKSSFFSHIILGAS